MSELSELYAACMVEYAGRQSDRMLSGAFYVFGKEARDAFNLPYDETIFTDALALLERIGALTRYQRKGVQTYYRLSFSSFTSAMLQLEGGKRKYQEADGGGLFSASQIAQLSGALSIGGARRKPNLLESYADLGSDYLAEVLEAFEPELAKIGAEPDDQDSRESDDEVDIEQFVPASDRIVRLDHNQIVNITAPVSELIEALEHDNGFPDQPGFRERLIGQIKAARELIRVGEYHAYLMYELLVRSLGEIVNRYGNPAIAALANALLGAVVSQLLQA